MKVLLLAFFVFTAELISVNCNDTALKLSLLEESRDYYNINGTFYYIGPTSDYMPTDDAARLCNSKGMRLLSLQTEDKENLIVNWLTENELSRAYWLSGIRYRGDSFLWSSTGEIFTYTNWYEGEPNAPSSQPDVCVLFAFGPNQWVDVDCGDVGYVMCEE